jgi:hypothetical protein
LQKFLVTLIVTSAQIAKLFGATGFIEHLQKNLEEIAKPGTGGKGGVSNVHLAGLEQISKDLAQAAATAAGGGTKGRGLEDIANEALEQLKKMGDNNPLQEELTKLAEKVQAYFSNAVGNIKVLIDGIIIAIQNIRFR